MVARDRSGQLVTLALRRDLSSDSIGRNRYGPTLAAWALAWALCGGAATFAFTAIRLSADPPVDDLAYDNSGLVLVAGGIALLAVAAATVLAPLLEWGYLRHLDDAAAPATAT
ncbi:MAG: hypothetical protein ACRD0Q_01830 [Acidimicrobiales bacterium]